MNKHWLFVLLASLMSTFLPAQTSVRPSPPDTLWKGGAWARMEIENGDTTFVMSLWTVRITQKRNFKDRDEQNRYYRYVRACRKVYPYALQAIQLYQEIQEETEDMNKRQRRRFIRKEHKELKEDFKEQMKKLTKTEGRVLIKMIEKQTEKPFYDLIAETRGGTTAAYWNTLGKLWGYDLKEGYRTGADPLLDDAFLDYDFGNPTYQY
ncbi:MAG: hypothetical protein OHK0019_20360 [Saprospiraceae bacterium]